MHKWSQHKNIAVIFATSSFTTERQHSFEAEKKVVYDLLTTNNIAFLLKVGLSLQQNSRCKF